MPPSWPELPRPQKKKKRTDSEYRWWNIPCKIITEEIRWIVQNTRQVKRAREGEQERQCYGARGSVDTLGTLQCGNQLSPRARPPEEPPPPTTTEDMLSLWGPAFLSMVRGAGGSSWNLYAAAQPQLTPLGPLSTAMGRTAPGCWIKPGVRPTSVSLCFSVVWSQSYYSIHYALYCSKHVRMFCAIKAILFPSHGAKKQNTNERLCF